MLSVSLGQVGVSVSLGTGLGEKGERLPLANLSLNVLKTKVSMFNDGALDLGFSLREIVMEDLRPNTTNQYRKVCENFFFGSTC